MRRNRIRASLALLALGVALSACGGGGPTTTPATTATTPAATSTASPPGGGTAGAAADLRTTSSSLGQIVVDGKGMSVYFFTNDTKDSGKSACTDPCVALWPAVTTTSDAPKAEGVTGTLGTITTSDGKKQVTLNGLPLYNYVEDKAPGDIKGQGFNNLWYLASPSGEMIKSVQPTTGGY